MLMKFRNIVLYLVLAVVSASCVREDLSGCVDYSDNKLLLSYKGDGTAEIFPDKICRVEMYVFDAGNRCVSSGPLPGDQLAGRTAVLPQLSPGTYRIVCLGNTHRTRVDNLSSCAFDQITFADEDYLSGRPVSGNDSLYYASVSYTVTDEDQTRTVEFSASHYDVLIEVSGLPDPEVRSGSVPSVQLCGVSPRTDFENCACGDAVDYTLNTCYENGLLKSRTNIMRHQDHAAVSVCLKGAAGETLAEINLADFLAENPAIDCSRNEVLIPIRFDFKAVDVTVSVPEWYLESIRPEF